MLTSDLGVHKSYFNLLGTSKTWGLVVQEALEGLVAQRQDHPEGDSGEMMSFVNNYWFIHCLKLFVFDASHV